MSKATLLEADISLGLADSFRGLHHYHDGGKACQHDSRLVLEEVRVLHLYIQTAEGDCLLQAAKRRLSSLLGGA